MAAMSPSAYGSRDNSHVRRGACGAASRVCLSNRTDVLRYGTLDGIYRGLLGKLLPQPRLGLIKVTSPSVCFNEGEAGVFAVVVGCNPFPIIGV